MTHSKARPGESLRGRAHLILVVLALSAGLVSTGCDTIESDSGPASDRPILRTMAAESSASMCQSGVQPSGALYEVCTPEGGNPTGTLVVYAHGFVFPHVPLHIPEVEGGISVRDFITDRAFAYAGTSYYTNGLVEPRKGAHDIRDLIIQYTRLYEPPERVLLLSFSNGTLLSTLELEKAGHLFDGALASCGPHGSYEQEIDYLADIFVLFDFFFQDIEVIPGFGPGMPGGPDGFPPALVEGLAAMAPPGYSAVDVLAQALLTTLSSNPAKTQQLLGAIQYTSSLSRGDMLFASAEEGAELVIRAVAYNVFSTNDVVEKLGGLFYDNETRVFGDRLPDAARQAINAGVVRYEADSNVAAQLESRYESTGHLRTPVVALHNTRDPLVPFWQESVYLEDLGSRESFYTLVPVEGYGHCTFTAEDLARGMDMLLEQIGAPDSPGL